MSPSWRLLAVCTLFLITWFDVARASRVVRVEREAMGTPVVVQVVADEAHVEAARAAIDAAFDEIERLEVLLSSWRPTSEISAINAAAGQSPVAVSAETLALVLKSIELGELTDGAFDITFGPLGRIWDFRRQRPQLPSRPELELALELVDFSAIEVDAIHGTVFLPRAGMRLGLGGIAKGYIVDRAVGVLRRHGFGDVNLNAGGDLRADGRRDGALWRIGIQHPRRPGELLTTVPITGVSLVTSGDYERFFELDGVRYHHIIDPATGMPADGCQSVTVISKDTGIADALATGIFVLGPIEGLGLAERLDDVEALIVTATGELVSTSGFRIEAPATSVD